MRGPDVEVANRSLARRAPTAARIRDGLIVGTLGGPRALRQALADLLEEDLALARALKARETALEAQGGTPKGDREHLTLRAARLFVRETVAEVSETAFRTCPDGSGRENHAGPKGPNVFTHQRAEYWSARTGFGPSSDVLQPLPTPRDAPRHGNSMRDLARAAALIAPFRVARTDAEREMARRNVALAGEKPDAWQKRAEAPTGESEALEWWIDRAVILLEDERDRDLLFYDFLLSCRGLCESAENFPD